MSKSGVAVDNECVPKFDDLKLKKTYKYIIYRLSDDKKSIIVEKDSSEDEPLGSAEDAHEKLLANLPENDCRYAVYDFSFDKGEGEGLRSKIVFISWSPDTAPVRPKMTYASSKDALRRALNGVAVEIQGSEFSEVAYETVLEKCSKGR